ncbi:MAG: hypothetical protein AAF456_19565 [Planctomycetota bacterium]
MNSVYRCTTHVLLTSVVLFLFCGAVVAQPDRNSTRKIRVKPDQLSSRAGMGVNWVDSVDEAMELAQETGRPVFWYVPTVRNTFMDRKPVIDLYMMAGPFSWEVTRSLLNENYICVRAAPDREEINRYNLRPYEFVEPGFLILNPDGTEFAKTDKITTFHPQWFADRLTRFPGMSVEIDWTDTLGASLKPAMQSISAGDYETEVPDPGDASAEDELNFAWLSGVVEFRRGNHQAAADIWREASGSHPDHPMAWKLAAEAQGLGPFVRGFEVYRDIPADAVSDPRVEGSQSSPGVYDENELRLRSASFLLGMQRSDGGWVDSDYDFGGTDSLPNVYVAVTSLCGMALVDLAADLPEEDPSRERMRDALARAAAYVCDDSNINRVDTDEILWAFAYRARFLSRYVAVNPDYRQQLQDAVADLENIQMRRGGGWSHEYRNPFVTGTALCALKEAADAGATVNMEVVAGGCRSLARDRFDNGAYPYSSLDPRAQDNGEGDGRQIAASAGRMPLCELGLLYWDASNAESLRFAVMQSMELHDNLDKALKYDNHTDNMAYGGFFFWYDMRGRSEAIRYMPDSPEKNELIAQQRRIILALPEFDGCFVDSHELGRCYGTAMAILSLNLD